MFDKNAKPSPQRQQQLDRYKQLVDRMSPKSDMAKGLLRAFWVGGAICCLGQALQEAAKAFLHMNNTAAGTFCSTVLVFLTALLTGVGVFDRIGQYAGAGAFVVLAALAILGRGALGGGDVKMMAVLGLWLGVNGIITTACIGFILGGIAAIIMLLLRIHGRKDFFAFGPFLIMGAVVAWLSQVLLWK